MTSNGAFSSPMPLSDIEAVLAWVDTFKLSRPTKKIHRDFSDAVLLAEILLQHYPKMVEMHNYPPRNSHALKLNNWMTLNRKVLKKLKINLCCNTMEQLANSVPGIIERVLIMVRDRIKRDEELNKTLRDAEQNLSSGGSYYEASGGDDNVLVVPLKMRVNGVLETIQQKVVSYDCYQALKQEMKDSKETLEILKQKVEHLDSLIKLKEERIEELQRQLDRKQARKKEVEIVHSCIDAPFDEPPPPGLPSEMVSLASKAGLLSKTVSLAPSLLSKTQSLKDIESTAKIKTTDSRTPIPKEVSSCKATPKPSIADVCRSELMDIESLDDINRVKSDVFKEAEFMDGDTEEFIDSEPGVVTIEETISNELKDIVKPIETQQE